MDASRYLRAEGRPRWLRVILVALPLVACGGGEESDALLIGYQRDLAGALDLPAPEPESPPNIGAFPERRERLLEIAETREGLLDVYALRECRITNLVAARNSQLGRVAPPSQRWLYELELWRRLASCDLGEVPKRLDIDARDRLTRWLAIKTEQLPRVGWNALFGSEEWQKQFSRASAVLSPEELTPRDDQITALAYLHEVVSHQFDLAWWPEPSRLEAQFKALQSRPYTAELLHTLMLGEKRIEEATGLLDKALEDRTCPDPYPDDEAFQTWVDGLATTAMAWFDALDALLEAQPTGPEAVRDYRHRWLSTTAAAAPLPAFETARDRHADRRQALMANCRRGGGT
jgi:hypothetical protein